MLARDRIITAKVRLQKDNPFFSYLVMALRIIEDEKVGTCAVDYKGNLYYAPKFIDTLNNEQVKTLLCHEVLHIALLHLLRRGERDRELFNISTDMVINNTLKNSNFTFGGDFEKKGIVPNNNEYTFPSQIKPKLTIKDIDKKVAEEIYIILNQKGVKEQLKQTYGKGGFDIHIYSDGTGEGKDKKDGKGNKEGFGVVLSTEEREKLEKEWKQRLAEATTYAKQQGKLPAGIERYVDELLQNKLNWREMLYKYITQEIPFDYSYNYPSKRSQAVGVYMPRTKKEMVDISIAVDTSGSIGREELQEFLSEIQGISKSFDSIRINLMFIDTEVNNHYVMLNGETDKLLDYKMGGGGGTSFVGIYDYIKENIPRTKLLVFFTDLFCDFPKTEEVKTIWVATKNSATDDVVPFGEIIRLI